MPTTPAAKTKEIWLYSSTPKKRDLLFTKEVLFKFAALTFMALLTAGLPSKIFADNDTRIINGERVGPNQADFYVGIFRAYSWGTGIHYSPMCGGSNIGHGQVLTAAHCLVNMTSNETLYALFGDTSDDVYMEYCTHTGISPYHCTTDKNGIPDLAQYHATHHSAFIGDPNLLVPFTVSQTRIHEKYNPKTFQNDVALIQFDQRFNHPEAQLPNADEYSVSANLQERGTATVIGYGDTLSDSDPNTFKLSDDLLFSILNANDTRYCQTQWGTMFDPITMICASSDVGKDTCQGDSGGPLVLTGGNTVYGITSFGSVQCGTISGVYARVFNYLDWIDDARLANGLKPIAPNNPADTGDNNSANDENDNAENDSENNNNNSADEPDNNENPNADEITKPSDILNKPIVIGTQPKDNEPAFRSVGSLNVGALVVFALLGLSRKRKVATAQKRVNAGFSSATNKVA